MLDPFDLSIYAPLKERFENAKVNKRIPHAVLLIGPEHIQLNKFARYMAASLLCKAETPCKNCTSCRLLDSETHPDLDYLIPESSGGVIKVDQIRELNSRVYTSPQMGHRRVIIINPAEKMNDSAANAFLKLLEEPPNDVYYVLIAEQVSRLLPTILSRCQKWQLPITDSLDNDYLELGEKYPKESGKGTVFAHVDDFVQDLLDMVSKKSSVVSLVQKWMNFDIHEVIWLVYLITCQTIYYQHIQPGKSKGWTKNLVNLSKSLSPMLLFKQLAELNKITRMYNKNINSNTTLVLENLLLGFTT